MVALRKRLTRARTYLDGLSQPHRRTLDPAALLRYSDKLQPLFTDEFLLTLEEKGGELPQMKASRFLLNQALLAPILSVTNLTVQPGESGFVLWLVVSSYFPLISACMAPISNLISLVCLIEKWGVIEGSRARLDNREILGLNIVSFIFGIYGNMSLVLNFSERMHYMTSQLVSVSCWIIAGSLLLAAIILATVRMDGLESEVELTEGYFFAAFTVFFYYACALIQSINFLGYTMKKYPPVFNLSRRQRSLMIYIVMFTIWEVVGTIAMNYLLGDVSYGTSLYFCTVSILTIGYGDIAPETPGAKAFDMVFCFVGVVLVGLIIAMIRQVVLTSAAPCIFWHRIELGRQKLLKQLEKDNIELTPEEAFEHMRKIRREVKFRQANYSFLIIIFVFIVFWLIGAYVFNVIEDWGYFNAVYYCFVTLLTIGYGDFSPNSPLARSVFVVWAFFAVPLMAVLISNASDTIFEWADRVETAATRMMHWKTYYAMLHSLFRTWFPKNTIPPLNRNGSETSSLSRQSKHSRAHSGLITLDMTDEPQELGPTPAERLRLIHTFINDDYDLVASLMNRIESLKKLIVDSVETPGKRYTHDEWMDHLDALNAANMSGDDSDFWLGDQSPLRLPIKEPSFLLLKMFVGVERDVGELLQSQGRSIDFLRRYCFEHGINPDELDEHSSVSEITPPSANDLSLTSSSSLASQLADAPKLVSPNSEKIEHLD